MGRVWVRLGEMGENFDFDLGRGGFCWGIWGGEVWCCGGEGFV